MATERDDLDHLQAQLSDAIGRDPAATLMRHLNPVPWPDVATKPDVQGVEQRLSGVEQRLDGVEQRLSGVEQRLDGVEQRLSGVEQRLDDITLRLVKLETKMDQTATKADIARIESSLIAKMNQQTMTMIFALITVVIAIASMALFR